MMRERDRSEREGRISGRDVDGGRSVGVEYWARIFIGERRYGSQNDGFVDMAEIGSRRDERTAETDLVRW
jgi:hypothetical protein